MHWTPDVAQFTIVCVGIMQGISVGLIFVPLATVVYATLPAELRVEAAGVSNLMRNMGSAIGISVTGALLQSNTQVNHAIIGGVATPFNHMLQTGLIGRLWNPATAAGAARLDAEVTLQSAIIAYCDDFKLMFVVTIIVMPLVVLLRPARPGVLAVPRAAE